MTGYRGKKEVRWLGPYASTDRHADDVTLSHIVSLRKKVSDLEEQLARVMSWITPIRQRKEKLENALAEAIEALDELGAKEDRDVAYAVLVEDGDAAF